MCPKFLFWAFIFMRAVILASVASCPNVRYQFGFFFSKDNEAKWKSIFITKKWRYHSRMRPILDPKQNLHTYLTLIRYHITTNGLGRYCRKYVNSHTQLLMALLWVQKYETNISKPVLFIFSIAWTLLLITIVETVL